VIRDTVPSTTAPTSRSAIFAPFHSPRGRFPHPGRRANGHYPTPSIAASSTTGGGREGGTRHGRETGTSVTASPWRGWTKEREGVAPPGEASLLGLSRCRVGLRLELGLGVGMVLGCRQAEEGVGSGRIGSDPVGSGGRDRHRTGGRSYPALVQPVDPQVFEGRDPWWRMAWEESLTAQERRRIRRAVRTGTRLNEPALEPVLIGLIARERRSLRWRWLLWPIQVTIPAAWLWATAVVHPSGWRWMWWPLLALAVVGVPAAMLIRRRRLARADPSTRLDEVDRGRRTAGPPGEANR
jgi:hypothetical protein